jgi:hypothetical protein
LDIRVDAAPWVPVEEVRIYVNGQLVRVIDKELSHPADVFGMEGTRRLQMRVPLGDLLPEGSEDAYVTVEAGTRLRAFGDLNEDGVPDTTDNNNDGRVDIHDVDEDDRNGCHPGSGKDSCGPILGPDEPEDDAEPLYHYLAVIPETYPVAFTNPLLLDRNGDGAFTGIGKLGVHGKGGRP